MTDRTWWIAAYDEEIAKHPDDGQSLAATREAVIGRWVSDVESGHLPEPAARALDVIGKDLFRAHVEPLRVKRRDTLSDDVSYLTDALKDDAGDASAYVDPMLEAAFPLGRFDGADKTLGHWTQDDWQQSSLARYRNAAAVTQSAKEFDEHAQMMIAAMEERQIRRTSDLYRTDGT